MSEDLGGVWEFIFIFGGSFRFLAGIVRAGGYEEIELYSRS